MFSSIINLQATPNEYIFPAQIFWGLTNAKVSAENWEKMYIYSPIIPIVSASAKELIPDSFKKNNVFYGIELPALQPRVMIQTKDTRFIFYCHYGDAFTLFDLIKESLIKNVVEENTITRSRNDLLINGKKAVGCMGAKQDGLVCEVAVLTLTYDDAFFKSLLPETFYRKGFPKGETGITGVLNEFPNANTDAIIKFIFDEAINRAVPYDKVDAPLSFAFWEISKDDIIKQLEAQRTELQSVIIGSV